MEKKLNKQQLEAIEHGQGPLLIIAGAGTGKTTVVTERIKYLITQKEVKTSEILALTFTEKAAREMEARVDESLPYGYIQMWISTFHSFCDRVLRAEAFHIGLNPNYKLMTEATSIQLVRKNLFNLNLNYFRPLGNPNKFVSGILQHFSRLQDEDVSPVDYINWINAKLQILNAKSSEEDRIEAQKWQELANTYQKYDDLKVKEGLFDYGDLIVKTLKLFRERPNVLKHYQEQFKYILVDEFQDTNYAQNQLAIMLAEKAKNITVVGDDDQCLPPDTRISLLDGDKKIKDIKQGEIVLTSVGKGHTSISKVLRIFKSTKDVRFLTFKMGSGKKIKVTDNHKMFCFLPAHENLNKWHFVYIMYCKDLGWRIGVTNNLPNRLRLERRADKIIGIGSYKTDQEARFFEAYYSAKYGIPTVPFSARPEQAISGNLLTRLFKDIDTVKNIRKLADDLNIELESPQFLVDAVTRGSTRRIKINFEMCARNYRSKSSRDGFVANPWVLHQVSLETSNPKTIKKLTEEGIVLLRAKKGLRVRKSFVDIKEAWEFAERLQKITDGIIDKRFKVGRFNYQHLSARIVPASHVFEGMYLPVLKDKEIIYEEVISRNEKFAKSEVYDLEVEKTHNFIADGVVVHNSVYRFRGAAVSNIIQFRKTYSKAKVVVLTKNYRSTQEILDRAYDLIQNNNPDRLEVVENIDKKLVSNLENKGEKIRFIHADRVENEADLVAKEIKSLVISDKLSVSYGDIAILVRANNHSEPFIRALQRHSIPYQFLGPGRLFKQPEIVDLISYLKVLYNFDDSVALYKLLTIDYFEISARDLAAIGNYARKFNKTLFEACEEIMSINVSEETKEKINKVIQIINKHLKLITKESAGQILYYFLQDSGLIRSLIKPKSPLAEKEAANISKFFDKLKTYEIDHKDAFVPEVVDWLELASEMGESPLAADSDWTQVNAVNILTVHSSKGLEFPVVFLTNLVSQRFPTIERREQIPIPDELIKEVLPVGDYHLEEERRLFYVGMTRAKNHLFFTAADYYGEGKREKKLSPFIFEALGDKVVSSEPSVANALAGKQLSFLDYKPQEILVTNDQSLVTKPHIDYLSYSQIETFKTCPLHYKLRYILSIPTAPSASQSFGTSIHSTFKKFYELVKNGIKPTEKLIFDIYKENWVNQGYLSKVHESKFFDKGKIYLSGFLQEEFNPKNLPILLEQKFYIPLMQKNERPLKIGGVIDRVDAFPDGSIEIIDYKTGANIPSQKEVDKNLQMTIYALAATMLRDEVFQKNPDEVTLSLYFLDNQEKISTKRTKEDLQNTISEIFTVRKEIENSDFKCSGNMFCQNCEYNLLCRSEENS